VGLIAKSSRLAALSRLLGLSSSEESLPSKDSPFITANTASNTTIPRATPAMPVLDFLCLLDSEHTFYNTLKRKICQNARNFDLTMTGEVNNHLKS